MNSFKKLGLSLVASGLIAEQTFADISFGTDKANALKGGSGADGLAGITNLITKFLTFVTVIAVIYVLWAGFKILTGGGDDSKLKEGKQIIINVIIGIALMWLAWSIVSWIMTAFQ